MKINKAIIKITGMIEYSAGYEKKLKNDGYRLEEDILNQKDRLNSSNYYKNSYYPEVRKMLFLDEKEYSSVKVYQKKHDINLTFLKKDKELSVGLTDSEIFLFPEKKRLGMFSLQLEITRDKSLEYVADINFEARSFNSIINSDSDIEKMVDIKWINWIEKNLLVGLKIHGDDVNVDDYSGSKFKIFTIIDTQEEHTHKDRCFTLYDIGCGVPIGSAIGKIPRFTPSRIYFDKLMKGNISVFNNWDALALFDSYTVIGTNLLSNIYSVKSYTTTYFRVYILNLYFKFNLYRFNAYLHEGTLSVRDEFEDFLNTYDINQIAFDFLPNLIYHTQRKALDTDVELKKFNKRISRISEGIQEQQQARTNALLTFVSIVASAGSLVPIYNNIEEVKDFLGWPSSLFYTILIILVLVSGFFLFRYIFSETYKSLSRKIKKLRAKWNL